MQPPPPSPLATAQPTRVVRVAAIDIPQGTGRYALVTDIATGSEFELPMSSPHRIKPQVGDIWVTDTSLGTWQFRSMLIPAKELLVQRLADLVGHLSDLGLVSYRPNDAIGPPEAVHSAYVGEIRDFATITAIPPGWLACNGQAVSRNRYANLFRVIGDTFGPGDGSSTFNLPASRFVAQRYPTLMKNVLLTSGMSTSLTSFYAPDFTLQVDSRTRMTATLTGAIGNTTAANQVTIALQRSGGTVPFAPVELLSEAVFWIDSSQTTSGRTYSNPSASVWTPFSFVDYTEFSAGETVSFNLAYSVTSSSVSIDAVLELRFDAAGQIGTVVQAICAY